MKKVFFNISNHPSKFWGEKQINAAKGLFNDPEAEVIIEDIPFPNVDPEWNIESVKLLGNKYFNEILEKVSNEKLMYYDIVIHLVGEMTFTHYMVTLFHNQNWKVVAATTKRIAIEENGVKISKFEFSQFREYAWTDI